jgi:large subunit ribosomal protein L6
MSRIGKLPISIPEGVTVDQQGNDITVKGPKGELALKLRPEVTLTKKDSILTVSIENDDRLSRELFGLSRTLVANQIQGVAEGFTKELEIRGVGYRAAMQGEKLVMQLGYSHPIEYDPPAGIGIVVEKNIVRVSGIDKQLVGQVASDIRAFRSPEPYKGKGVRYVGEYVRRKAGKTGKAA